MSSAQSDAFYVMGQSQAEQERLIAQSGFFAPATRRLLVEAGLTTGMRVLDVGCGVGDVSLLCAELVGPTGSVVGVDRDEAAVARAEERVGGLGYAHVTFRAGDFRTLDHDEPFDAVVGRLVLMYQADPVAAVRSLLPRLRPGGVVAFHEMESSVDLALPASPTYHRFIGWWNALAEKARLRRNMGLELYGTLAAAGVQAPRVHVEAFAGGGSDFAGYQYIGASAKGLLPALLRFGIATEEEVGADTLAERIRDEVVSSGGCMTMQLLFGAWGRVPADT